MRIYTDMNKTQKALLTKLKKIEASMEPKLEMLKALELELQEIKMNPQAQTEKVESILAQTPGLTFPELKKLIPELGFGVMAALLNQHRIKRSGLIRKYTYSLNVGSDSE